MKRRPFGIITIVIIYAVIFIFFDPLLGETPVNLLGLGSREGGSNLLINIFCYSVISLLIYVIIGLFVDNKVNWITQGSIGCLFAIIATIVVITFWYMYSLKQDFNPL